jgi:hypothetical protein
MKKITLAIYAIIMIAGIAITTVCCSMTDFKDRR